MKILILSQWCYPEPDIKALTFARELAGNGHSVQILTGFPNYPGGKLYPGYKVKWSQREVIDGIEIIRVPLYPSHDKSGLKRMLNYVSFAFSAAILGVFRVRKADVMYVYHPPPTIAMAAFMIRLFRRIPVVYDIQDMWPDTLRATGMLNNRTALKIISSYMKWCYRRFNHIVVLSGGFRRLLLERGVPGGKVSVIYNWSNPVNVPGSVDPVERKSILGDKFTILFAGTIGVLQGLDIVLSASEILRSRGINDVQFALLGGGVDVDRLKEETAKRKLDNVLFLPRVSNAEVGKYLKMADVLLIHLINDELFEITVPSKTQAYMLAGKPILVGVKGDAAKLVSESGSGYFFEPEDASSLVENILKLKALSPTQLDEMGRNGLRYYQNNLSIEKGVINFVRIFEQVSKN